MVAIKGMEIPADCATCEFSGRFTYLCNLVHREYYGKQRPRADWCPLVEVNCGEEVGKNDPEDS